MSIPCTTSLGVVSLRDADRGDHDAIRAVVRAAYGQYQPVLGDEVYRRYLDDLLDIDLHAGRGRLIVAELDGAIAASAAFYPDATRQGLGWPSGWASGRGLAVHPAARGRGVARAMLTTFEQLARQAGAAAFGFHTGEFMTSAVALYQRMGYERAPAYDTDLGTIFGIETARQLRSIAFYRSLTVRVRGTNTPAYFLNRPAHFWRRAMQATGREHCPPSRRAFGVNEHTRKGIHHAY